MIVTAKLKEHVGPVVADGGRVVMTGTCHLLAIPWIFSKIAVIAYLERRQY